MPDSGDSDKLIPDERPYSLGLPVTFLQSLSGWQWGLALAVPAVIVALYFLRLRRQPLEVPSTLLWKKSIEDLRVNSLWQRLRRNLLLLLQLLAVAAALLALLRPAWNVTESGRRIILLIDQSASMSARDRSPTRLDEAKTRALEQVEQMRPGDAAMVIAFADAAQVAAAYTEDAALLKRAIRSIPPTDRPTDPRAALSIAAGLANPQRILADPTDAEIVPEDSLAQSGIEATLFLFSDGRFPPLRDFSLGNLSVEYIQIGASGENVGIMSLASRKREDDSEATEIFARIKNFGKEPAQRQIELKVDGERFDLRRVEISAGGETSVPFPGPDRPSAMISLHLEPADLLPNDDSAYATTSPALPARVLWFGPASPVLDAVFETPSLRAIAQIEHRPAAEATSDLDASLEADPRDLIIFDRCAPERMPPVNTWFIGAVPPDVGIETVAVETPVVLSWEPSHPALRFLALDDVAIFRGRSLGPGDGVARLIETDKGTILWSRARGLYTDLVLSIPLVDDAGNWQTDWPLRPSFPLFAMNTIRFLGRVDLSTRSGVRVGEPIILRPTAHPKSIRVSAPGEEPQVLTPRGDGVVEFRDTARPGFVRFDLDGADQSVAVNLFDEAESEILPKPTVELGAVAAEDAGSKYQGRLEGWRWLVLAALGIVLVEWYIYNQRVYI